MKEILQKLKSRITENDKLKRMCLKAKEHLLYYILCTVTGLYLYGIVINIVRKSTESFYSGVKTDTFLLNPFTCIAAVFTPQGLGVLIFIAIMYVLISGKWTYLITGVKITKDGQKADFWDKAEGNLLIALILYVQSMRDPITNELLPCMNGHWVRYIKNTVERKCKVAGYEIPKTALRSSGK